MPRCARWRPARPACSCTRCAPSSPTRRSICARRWRPSASPWSRSPASPRVDERRQAFAGLADGSVDIALTTPEFLAWHADSVRLHRPRQVRGGRRGAPRGPGAAPASASAYAHHRLRGAPGWATPRCSRSPPPPTTRCAQATSTPRASASTHAGDRRLRPRRTCAWTTSRNVPSRDDYLANLVATGEKTVVFVNSREQSVAVARALRKHAPQVAPLIGFYNAGLSRSERKRIEQLFRTDDTPGAHRHQRVRRGRGYPEHPPRGAVPHALQRDRIQPDVAAAPDVTASRPACTCCSAATTAPSTSASWRT